MHKCMKVLKNQNVRGLSRGHRANLKDMPMAKAGTI